MWTELNDATTTIFNRQIYVYMYFMWIIKNIKDIILRTYSKKINIKNVRNITTTDSRISYATCIYFYNYKLKAIPCMISPNCNMPVCAHNPTNKASVKNTNTTQSTTTTKKQLKVSQNRYLLPFHIS